MVIGENPCNFAFCGYSGNRLNIIIIGYYKFNAFAVMFLIFK